MSEVKEKIKALEAENARLKQHLANLIKPPVTTNPKNLAFQEKMKALTEESERLKKELELKIREKMEFDREKRHKENVDYVERLFAAGKLKPEQVEVNIAMLDFLSEKSQVVEFSEEASELFVNFKEVLAVFPTVRGSTITFESLI